MLRTLQSRRWGSLRGQTWDVVDVILPSGETIRGYQEYTWGTRFYFEQDGKWYVASQLDFEELGSNGLARYDLNQPVKGF